MLTIVVAFAVGLVLLGCSTTKYQQPPPLTQDDIISMAKAGKSDQEIIQEIKTRHTYYRLSAKDIVNLHDNGVSYPVIDYMLETQMDAIRDESRYYYRDYWYPYYGHWYYG